MHCRLGTANGGTWLVSKKGYDDVNRNHIEIYRRHSVPRLHIQHRADSKPAGDTVTRYISDYLGTMRRALSKVDWEHCWVTADVCDYTDLNEKFSKLYASV